MVIDYSNEPDVGDGPPLGVPDFDWYDLIPDDPEHPWDNF